jgi:hypothetical protein
MRIASHGLRACVTIPQCCSLVFMCYLDLTFSCGECGSNGQDRTLVMPLRFLNVYLADL